MPAVPDEVLSANKLHDLSDEELMRPWHAAISKGDDDLITAAESSAATRFGVLNFCKHYAKTFPEQTSYPLQM